MSWFRTTMGAPPEPQPDATAEQLAAALDRVRRLELRIERLERAVQATINIQLPPLE